MIIEISLDELERDALTELVNIGVSRAATSLRKMVGRQVLLSVPSVDIVSRRMAAALIGQREKEDLTAIQQDFHGPFTGRALLIFPESNGHHLTLAVLGEAFGEIRVDEIEAEALVETGNIIIGACLGSIANMLGQTVCMSLPFVRRGASEVIFEVAGNPKDDGIVLFLYIDFSVRDRQIKGYLAMLVDMPALIALKELIAAYLERVLADTH